MKGPIENVIYSSIISDLKSLEREGSIKINYYRLAVKLSHNISIGLLPPKQRKLFNVLTKEDQTTKEIASKVNMTTKIVSTQLNQMQNKTLLISSKLINERRKVWSLKL